MWESISSQSSGSPDFSPADGPTLTYWIKDTLYVAVTNRCNVRTLSFHFLLSVFLPPLHPFFLSPFLPWALDGCETPRVNRN